jgi:hypothetical protein
MWDAGYEIRDTGYGIRDTRYEIRDFGISGFRDWDRRFNVFFTTTAQRAQRFTTPEEAASNSKLSGTSTPGPFEPR